MCALQVTQIDAQFVNLAHASKQLLSELKAMGSEWGWEEAAMGKYWDPNVPFQRLHARNDTGDSWEYGFNTPNQAPPEHK